MLTNGLPFLPGHVFSDPMKTKFAKDQLWNYKQNTCVEKFKGLEPIDPYTINSIRGVGLGNTVQVPVPGQAPNPYRTAPSFFPRRPFISREGTDAYPRIV